LLYNKRNGIGKCFFKNKYYEGMWANDKIEGFGKLVSSNEEYEGYFIKGKKEG
jgi:hypothetical protein